MTIIKTVSGNVEIDQLGSGRNLVLLHSLLTDYSAFDRMLPELVKHHRVTLVRLPGFGHSDPVADNIDAYADALAALFDALKLPPQTDIMGNGFGGFVAVAFAVRHGHRFERLLAVDTGAGFPDEGKTAFRVMDEAVSNKGMGGILEAAAARLFPESYREQHPGLVNACKAVLLRADPTAFVNACRTLGKLDLREQVTLINNPTLVVFGSEDAATPPPMSHELAALIPGSQLIELKDCGHAPQIQQPDTLLQAISPFLKAPIAA
tara:strand:- start:4768 stop:5559 length:792 start_codon:yes stop_codon:yes gene_type:complete